MLKTLIIILLFSFTTCYAWDINNPPEPVPCPGYHFCELCGDFIDGYEKPVYGYTIKREARLNPCKIFYRNSPRFIMCSYCNETRKKDIEDLNNELLRVLNDWILENLLSN